MHCQGLYLLTYLLHFRYVLYGISDSQYCKTNYESIVVVWLTKGGLNKKPLTRIGPKAFLYYFDGADGPGGAGGGGGKACGAAQLVNNMAHIAASVTMLMIFFFIL